MRLEPCPRPDRHVPILVGVRLGPGIGFSGYGRVLSRGNAGRGGFLPQATGVAGSPGAQTQGERL